MVSSARLTRMVDNLSDFASLQAGRTPIMEGDVLPDRLAEEVVEELRPAIRDARLHVAVSPGGGGAVRADPRKLRQALANLVSNAVKFSPHGADVLVVVAREPAKLRYAIYDQGPGIAPAEQEGIFEPLHHAATRGGDEARAPGSGLGLPVTRRIAEAHGGRVWVESPPRSQPAHAPRHYTGCKFVLEIPVSPPSSRPSPAPPRAPPWLERRAPERYIPRSSEAHADPGRHVRRGGQLHRRRAPRRRRPRGGRRHPARGRSLRRRARPLLLRAGRRGGRPRRRPPARHPVLRRERRGALPRAGDRPVRGRLRRGAHPQPVRRLQHRGEVRLAAGAGARARGEARHRPLRARRGARGPPGAARRGRSGQGPELLPLRARARTRCATCSSRWGRWRSPRCGPRPPRAGLANAAKPDSQEILLRDPTATRATTWRSGAGAGSGRARSSPPRGEVLGRHGGVHRFTVGQRRGLGLSGPAPRYVVRIDAATARVVVGDAAEAARDRFEVREVSWVAGAPPPGPDRAPGQGPPPPRGRGRHGAPRRGGCGGAAGASGARGRARPGGGLLRRRRGGGRRADRLTRSSAHPAWKARGAALARGRASPAGPGRFLAPGGTWA